MKRYESYLLSFETIKGLVMSLSLVLPIYLGLQTDSFEIGFCFALGTIFTFLPNIDGSQKQRLVGMLISLGLCLVLLAFTILLAPIPKVLFLLFFSLSTFAISLISIFSFRGAMIAFSGNAAMIMAFSLLSYSLPLHLQLLYIGLGGLNYITLAGISHWLFQNRNIALQLAACAETTADLLKLRYRLRWEKADDDFTLEKTLIRLQIKLNGQHELLRELLFKERRDEGQSDKTSRLLLIFLEIIDLYELALASSADFEKLHDTFDGMDAITKPFKEMAATNIVHVYALSEALKTSGDIPLMHVAEPAFIQACEQKIAEYVAETGLPKARTGALVLRNLLDFEIEKWEKIETVNRLYANKPDKETWARRKGDRRVFISAPDYSLNTLKANLSFESPDFRHALRLTFSMLLGLLIGHFFQHENFYWILLTISVILRPNYGITKERALHRIVGTLLGALFAFLIISLTSNKFIYGILAVPATFVGFTFLQRSYRIAATFITICVLLLYAILIDNTVPIIAFRIADTFIGAAISFFAVFLLWPTWEVQSIRGAIEASQMSLHRYLREIDRIYTLKTAPDIAYRLSRKRAFLDCGALMASFQRLIEEPRFKQEHQAQIYAMVVLHQTFLNATAALGIYIQNHETTPASEAYKVMIGLVLKSLEKVNLVLENEDVDHISGEKEHETASILLENKFHDLEKERDEELKDGFTVISQQMRNKLQEGRMITDQLKWLYSLTDSMKQVAVHLKQDPGYASKAKTRNSSSLSSK